jgi:DNA-binding CsgD family transcriptional regulator
MVDKTSAATGGSFDDLSKLTLYLAVIFGLACAWCYFFSGLVYNEQLSAIYDATASASGSAVWFLLGIIAALFAGNFFADFWEGAKGVAAACAYAGVAALLVLALSLLGYTGAINSFVGAALGVVLLPLTFFLIGTLVCLVFLFWFDCLPFFDKKFVSVCLAASALGGGFLYIFINLLDALPRCIILVVLLLVSLALAYILRRHTPTTARPSRAQTISGKSFLHSTDLSLVLYGTIFGFAVGLILRSIADVRIFVFCGIAIMLAAGVTLLFLLRNSQKMMLGKVQRFVYPLLVIGLLPLPFVPADLRIVFLLLLLCCFVCFDLVHIDSVLCGFRIKPCSIFYVNTRARLPLMIGLLVGCLIDRAIGLIVFDNPTVFTVCILIFIAALALCIVFVRIEPDRLRIETTAQAERPSRVEYSQIVGAQNGLSPREIEVLELLSRGHGSKFIQRTLFISDGTVKTHTSNIYRKLKITTREDLLAIFDQNCEV